MLDAAADLTEDLGPSTVVDAVVGRQVSDGIERLSDYRAAGRLNDLSALVIGLGTNGPMSVAQCDQILALAVGCPRRGLRQRPHAPGLGAGQQRVLGDVHGSSTAG